MKSVSKRDLSIVVSKRQLEGWTELQQQRTLATQSSAESPTGPQVMGVFNAYLYN